MASSSPSSLMLPPGSSSGKSTKRHGTINVFDKVQGLMNINVQCSNLDLGIRAREKKMDTSLMKRRDHVIGLVLGVSSLCNIGLFDDIAKAAGLPPEDKPRLCDENCEKELENVPMVTTESGLQFKDIKVGQGPSPLVGFQLAFLKGLTSAPGRPRVAPNSPVVFDVSLEYIPGLEVEEE
ncbi:peptidyl-prolyl cis-trans isomerase FKBP16-3 [Populus alba x Populus x berolinensis]|uniref:Peptidyl-prolyl cis-trans isomerase FKBP16-3 n=1 Tax=Populus alba x Populus x berolinensis TaxID=444605 RepID=A0AAD6QJD5_9ROSI|nr:peptidyl-prolyl cis-trans isomerase FKBP16-3 [Populus alba x Populus x berolinensis]